jgi:hypothetical protein
MYRRPTRQRRQHGPEALYSQLAENYSQKERRRSATRIIAHRYTFGRADQVDPEALRRLAHRILRVANDARIALPAHQFPADGGIDDREQVVDDGVLSAAHALWEEVGIGPRLRDKMQPDGCDAPHKTALFAMTANRRARPASKVACSAHWLADEGDGPAAKAWALEHRYRALDFLRRHSEALEQELFLRPADLLNADVELLFWDTTPLYGEIDDDDGADVWEDPESPALRKRGHHQDGRAGNPPVVVGLALTRDGLPVRAWVFPGNSADVTTLTHRKADLRGGRLNRGVFVGDSLRRPLSSRSY